MKPYFSTKKSISLRNEAKGHWLNFFFKPLLTAVLKTTANGFGKEWAFMKPFFWGLPKRRGWQKCLLGDLAL
jgi:hypothetical protein